MKDSFVIYTRYAKHIKKLSVVQRGFLLTAIMAYAEGSDEEFDLDPATDMIFGIIKESYEEYLRINEGQKARQTPEYHKWRRDVLKRDHYTCQKCGHVGGKLHVHHIIKFSESVELRTELSNGITLCEKCHKEVHHGK